MGRLTDNFLLITAFAALLAVVHSITSCPPLIVLPGTVVKCELPREKRELDCLQSDAEIPRGTVAKYGCERHGNFSENILKCKCKGKWKGLRLFNDYMSACNISDYTAIDGPKELNLTQNQIQQLSSSDIFKGKDYQEEGLAYHNFYREIHHVPQMKLNQTLSDAAEKWANQEVDKPTIRIQPWAGRWYSQNMYRYTGLNVDAREAVKLAVAAWYQGAYRYNWENPSGQSAFTQVVWKSSTDLGIGVAQKGNYTVVCADYWPAGNVIVDNAKRDDKWAWFRENVFPPNRPLDEPTETSDAVLAVQTTLAHTMMTTEVTTAGKPPIRRLL